MTKQENCRKSYPAFHRTTFTSPTCSCLHTAGDGLQRIWPRMERRKRPIGDVGRIMLEGGPKAPAGGEANRSSRSGVHETMETYSHRCHCGAVLAATVKKKRTHRKQPAAWGRAMSSPSTGACDMTSEKETGEKRRPQKQQGKFSRHYDSKYNFSQNGRFDVTPSSSGVCQRLSPC